MVAFGESTVEKAALDWLAGLGWRRVHGPEIAPEMPSAERADYGEVLLTRRLRGGAGALNPDLPTEALDDAFRKLTRPEGPTLEARNRAFHRLLRIFRPEVLPGLVRRKAELFDGETALDWILRGCIDEVVDHYESALSYQA